MALSKEEFQEAIAQMYSDAKNPNGELAGIKEDFLEIYEDVKPHDEGLAACLSDVNAAMLRLEQYVVNRVEG